MTASRQFNTCMIDAITALPIDADTNLVKSKLQEAYDQFPYIDSEACNQLAETPLMVAAKLGHLTAVQWLLKPPFFSWRFRADANYLRTDNACALSYAVAYEDLCDVPLHEQSPEKKKFLERKRDIINLLLQQASPFFHDQSWPCMNFGEPLLSIAHAAVLNRNIFFINKIFDKYKKEGNPFFYSNLFQGLVRSAIKSECPFMVSYIVDAHKSTVIFVHLPREVTLRLISLFKKDFDKAASICKSLYAKAFRMEMNIFFENLDDLSLLQKIVMLTPPDPITWKALEKIISSPNNQEFITFLLQHPNYLPPVDSETQPWLLTKNLALFKYYYFAGYLKLSHETVIAAIINKNPEVIFFSIKFFDSKDHGFKIIHQAARMNDFKLMIDLLEAGVDYSPSQPLAAYGLNQKYISFLDAFLIIKNSERKHLILSKISKLEPDMLSALIKLFKGDYAASQRLAYAVYMLNASCDSQHQSQSSGASHRFFKGETSSLAMVVAEEEPRKAARVRPDKQT